MTPSELEEGSEKSAVHFGLMVRRGAKYGLRIRRDTYASISKVSSHWFPRQQDVARWEAESEIFEDADHKIYTDVWCELHQKDALENFDLNMERFEALSAREFDLALEMVVLSYPKMQEVIDLNDWVDGSVVYIMVLDQFKQAYVGIARSAGGMKKRIRQHWSSNKQFDRLLHGPVNESKISIDSFRALDTTQIFAMRIKSPEAMENQILESFPSKFVLNRIAGGTPQNSNELRWLENLKFLNDFLP